MRTAVLKSFCMNNALFDQGNRNSAIAYKNKRVWYALTDQSWLGATEILNTYKIRQMHVIMEMNVCFADTYTEILHFFNFIKV